MWMSRSMERTLALVVLLFLCAGGGAQAQEFFPLDEVRPGLWGIARTVVTGTQIDTFSVEVLGVLHDAGPSGTLILIRASGDVIDRVGGIAAGMSGSPVYIDGKLLGAIGYGFSMADHRIGLVTPIEDMLAVLDRVPVPPVVESAQARGVPGLIDVSGLGIDGLHQVAVAPDALTAAEWTSHWGEGVWVASPVESPLLVSGLGDRTLDRLGEVLAPFNVRPIRTGGAPFAAGGLTHFEPGAAIGVQLARGDVNVTSIGTVTYVDEHDRFLAFGHTFMNMGAVDFISTTAHIHQTIQSLQFPFKLGAPLTPIGRLTQDRTAAIAGVAGALPETISLVIHVLDRDLGSREQFRVELVQSELLTMPLTAIASLEAIDRAIDRLGPGTARTVMQISGDGLPRRVVRDNLYYSQGDVAAAALIEFLTGVQALAVNEFQDVRLTNLRLDVEVEQARWTARIVPANRARIEAYPGDTVDVEVELRPYRGAAERKIVRLPIPHDVEPGEVTVSIRPGGVGDFRLAAPPPQGIDVPSDFAEPDEDDGEAWQVESLENLIDTFVSREKNNEVVVEFFPPRNNFRGADSDEPDSDPFGAGWFHRSGIPQPVRSSLSTRYVVQGGDTFTLRILRPVPAPPEAGPEAEPEPEGEAEAQPGADPAEPSEGAQPDKPGEPGHEAEQDPEPQVEDPQVEPTPESEQEHAEPKAERERGQDVGDTGPDTDAAPQGDESGNDD